MPENNQASDATKPEAAGSSSTQPNSLAIDMSHADAIVPHKISNHDKLVQTMVMVDGEWINVNDANDQKNVQKDMHKVNRVVTEAQKGIVEAKNTADSAVAYADSAVSASKVNSDAIAAQSSAISEAKAATNSAMSRAESAWNVATGAKEAVTDFDPLLKSAQSDASKALTGIADTASVLSDAKTAFGSDVAEAKELANTAQTTANNAVAVASDAKSNATVAVQTASGASVTAKNAQDDATIAKQTAGEATVQASNAESDFAQLSIRANKIEANVATNSGAITSVQQTANGLTTTVADIKANGGGVNLVKNTSTDIVIDATNSTTNNWAFAMIFLDEQPKLGDLITVSAEGTLTGTGTLDEYQVVLYNSSATNSRSQAKYLKAGQRDSVTLSLDNLDGSGDTVLLIYAGKVGETAGKKNVVHHLMVEKGTVAHTWSPALEDLQAQFTQIKTSIDGVTTTINDPKTGLNATYQTAAGNATTISNVKGDVSQLETTANGLTSRVGSLESKTNTQQTAIEQNKKDITLKADQTTVNTLEGTVSQNSATLKTQANEISSKVTRSDVTGMLTGYATQGYTQSLVTQKADQWNLDLTSLKTDVNAIKTTGGGVNLVSGTTEDIVVDDTANTGTQGWRFYVLPINADLKVGDKITVSVENVTMTGKGDLSKWVATLYSKDISEMRANNYEVNAGKNAQVTITVTSMNDPNKQTALLIYSGRVGDTEGKKAVFHHLMVEKGTVAHDWSPAPSDMATVTSVTNLSAAVDGLKSTVANKADQSTVTQLSNALQSKVESSTYTSAISQLSSDINLRVKSADLISQINIEAGNTLIQSNKIYLDAKSVVFGQNSEAFIPAALITNLSADYIKTGVLDASIVKVKNFNADAINAGTLSGIDIQSTDNDGNKYEMIGPNLYWFSPHSKARVGQAHKGDNELDMFFTDLNHKKIIGNDDFYSIIGAPDVAIASAGDWGEQGKDAINSPNYYPKFFLKGWTSEEAYETDEYIGAGAYLTSGGTTLALKGDFSPVLNGEQSYGTSFEKQVDNSLYVNGWHGFTFNLNHLNDGTHPSDWQKNAVFQIQKDQRMTAYFGDGDQGNNIRFVTTAGGCVTVDSSLMVTKSKNAVVPTSQGTVAINAYETAEYYFGDIGEDKTNDSNKVWVSIDYLFGQTVNTTMPYQVFVTPYSSAHVWVSKRLKNRFLVESDQPNASFAWEIKAKRKGYEHTRLKNVDNVIDKPAGVK